MSNTVGRSLNEVACRLDVCWCDAIQIIHGTPFEGKAGVVLCLAAMVKAVGHLEKSTEVMAEVNKLIKIPELTTAMREMSKEMMKVRPGINHISHTPATIVSLCIRPSISGSAEPRALRFSDSNYSVTRTLSLTEAVSASLRHRFNTAST
eukprot:6153381-Pyramimonas_sp.AAC.2